MGLSFEYVDKLYAGFRERFASPRFTNSEILRRGEGGRGVAVLPTPYTWDIADTQTFFRRHYSNFFFTIFFYGKFSKSEYKKMWTEGISLELQGHVLEGVR